MSRSVGPTSHLEEERAGSGEDSRREKRHNQVEVALQEEVRVTRGADDAHQCENDDQAAEHRESDCRPGDVREVGDIAGARGDGDRETL